MFIPDIRGQQRANSSWRCCGGMAVTKKRSIPSDLNPEVVVYDDDVRTKFRTKQ